MSRVLWVTGCNSRYFHHMEMYLNSLERCSPFQNYLVTVGFEISTGWRWPHISQVGIETERNHGAPAETECIQHGSFLQALPGDPDDVLVYTDGDITMQRRPHDDEIDWLANFPDNRVSAGWNSGPDETLLLEAARLHPRVQYEHELAARFGEMIYTAPCFNVGVCVARRSTWERIYHQYMLDWPLACETFGHAARQQWLICREFTALGLDIQVMPQTFHSHGHYGIPAGVTYSDCGGVLFAGQPVLLRHKL